MRLFGTDGIRGRVNNYPMTPEVVLKTGMAIAKVLKELRPSPRNMVLIGKDTRISGYLIESALTAGICSMGVNVTLIGPMPTPGIAFLARTLRLDAGIVISASHNPFYDNGIKIFSSDGFKFADEFEKKIERLVSDKSFPSEMSDRHQIGKALRLDDAVGRYIEYVKSTIPRRFNLEGIKVVVDAANGSAYKVTPILLEELGAHVITINDNPNGLNINDKCGSTYPDCISKAVKGLGADIGIAHDGDADRTIFVDEKGDVIDGDKVLTLWACEFKAQGRLNGDGIVATVMTNSGIERYLSSHGIRLIRTKVGDRYVVEEMLKGGYNLGGEQSGHIIFLDYNTTGDGPITALQVLYLMKKNGRAISQLTKDIKPYPQMLLNISVCSKDGIDNDPDINKAIKEGDKILGGEGRILVRPSGTESKIRVMVEAQKHDIAKTIAEKIAKTIYMTRGKTQS